MKNVQTFRDMLSHPAVLLGEDGEGDGGRTPDTRERRKSSLLGDGLNQNIMRVAMYGYNGNWPGRSWVRILSGTKISVKFI